MNKRVVSISVVFATVMILLISQATMLEAKPQPRAAGGEFDDGDFFAPDYNNGGSETFDAGENRTFNYNCHCANQPGQKPCNGYIRLQVDTGSGFVDEKSDACNIGEGQTCSASHTKTFDTADTYKFRVFCDENAGTDYTQPSNEHVVLTVESTGCVENETRPCPLQQGVCEGANQTCVNGSWTDCDYGYNYETVEATCDDLDNDCDGLTDEVDSDGDVSSPCGGMGVVNELLISGLNADEGNISIFEYNPTSGKYEIVWSNDSADITGSTTNGGEIGDVNHDGVNDFVIIRNDVGNNLTIEVWTYNSLSQGWYRLWFYDFGTNNPVYFGDIGDFDNDGKNEFLISRRYVGRHEVWGNDTEGATSFSLNATVLDCGGTTSVYHKAAGDLDGNGVPELFLQCGMDTNIQIFEWNGTDYEKITEVEPPLASGSSQLMLIDDMECGDVDRDTIDECVFCGNSKRSHVLDYSGGTYSVVYNSSSESAGYTQTCSIGDVTNDGWPDFFDTSQDGVRVFSYNGTDYENVWNSGDIGWASNPAPGSSFAGDSDNDGRNEFIHAGPGSSFDVWLWENNSELEAESFNNTLNWTNAVRGHLIIGDLNPYNDDMGVDCNDSDNSIYPGALEICGDGVDQNCDGNDTVCNCVDGDNDTYYAYDQVYCPTGDDCNDNNSSINPGAQEVCGDGVDNDCDDEIDEGCEVCGNDYCAGSGLGEDCFTCPDDCLCSGPSCSKACCGDGTCSSPFENANKCPVDCS